MSQKEFSGRMDMSEKHISRLINGKVELSHDVALRLESVFGIPAKFWNNLEAIYREQEARVREELDLEYDEEIASKMPYTKCAGLGWIPKAQSIKEKVYNLRSYFEVANLRALESLKVPGIAFRKASSSISSDYSLAMWAQKARIEARNIPTDPVDVKQLTQIVSKIRSLTTTEPTYFCEEIRALLAKCGVALVFLPQISGSFLHGATFYDGAHIVLGLTVRGKYADKFWFSLFHEIGHIVCGHISDNSDDYEENEKEADRFAQDTLIPANQ
jgi:HTH-type transcriptional regulator/antitoxin HigA